MEDWEAFTVNEAPDRAAEFGRSLPVGLLPSR